MDEKIIEKKEDLGEDIPSYKIDRLSKQVVKNLDGTISILRFNKRQRIEHNILIFTFFSLGITGLVQRYAEYTIIQWIINVLMGGIETVRVIHHQIAVIFVAQSFYHIWKLLEMIFVEKEVGYMWPSLKDMKDLGQMVKYNLGRAKSRPDFDRYNIEEKVEYWALIWGNLVMIITGFIQWFPILFSRFFPGSVIPVARSIHSWEAVLAVLAILIWHGYHTLIKEDNKSIFDGMMSEEMMEENHPIEYKRIMKAYEIAEKKEE